MKKLAVLLMIVLLAGCSKEIEETDILYTMEWEGKEVTFYETSNLSYTDGEKTYSSGFHMMDSEDGTKRLYVVEDAFGIEINLIQEGVVLEPAESFVVNEFEGEAYENAFEMMQKLGMISEDMALTNTVAKVYSLDKSKPVSMSYENMPKTIARKWSELSDNHFRGDIVSLTFEELESWISSWTKTSAAKNQIDPYQRKILVSWENISSNQLIYENGMEMHVPEIEVNSVIVNDKTLIEVENRLEYSNASIEYYELTETQMDEFLRWVTELKR